MNVNDMQTITGFISDLQTKGLKVKDIQSKIKELTQEERKLLLEIIKNPTAAQNTKGLAGKIQALQNTPYVSERHTGLLWSVARFLGNTFTERKSSKHVLEAIQQFSPPKSTPPGPTPTQPPIQQPIQQLPIQQPIPHSVTVIQTSKTVISHETLGNAHPNFKITALKVHQFVMSSYNVLFPQEEGKEKDIYSTKVGYSQHPKTKEIKPNEDFRLEVKLKNLKEANRECIALQEVTKKEFEALEMGLKDAGYVGVYCPHDLSKVSAPRSHGVAIFYKTENFRPLSAKKVQFSAQRRMNGVLLTYPNGKPIMQKRSHLLLDLQDITTGLVTRVVSCHLADPRDWIPEEKHKHVAAVVEDALSKPEGYEVDLVAVLGDMNQDQYGDHPGGHADRKNLPPADLFSATAFKPFKEHGFEADKDFTPSEYEKAEPDNFNSKVVPKGENRRIDYIMVKLCNQKLKMELNPVQHDDFDVRGSDHKAVNTEIKLS